MSPALRLLLLRAARSGRSGPRPSLESRLAWVTRTGHARAREHSSERPGARGHERFRATATLRARPQGAGEAHGLPARRRAPSATSGGWGTSVRGPRLHSGRFAHPGTRPRRPLPRRSHLGLLRGAPTDDEAESGAAPRSSSGRGGGVPSKESSAGVVFGTRGLTPPDASPPGPGATADPRSPCGSNSDPRLPTPDSPLDGALWQLGQAGLGRRAVGHAHTWRQASGDGAESGTRRLSPRAGLGRRRAPRPPASAFCYEAPEGRRASRAAVRGPGPSPVEARVETDGCGLSKGRAGSQTFQERGKALEGGRRRRRPTPKRHPTDDDLGAPRRRLYFDDTLSVVPLPRNTGKFCTFVEGSPQNVESSELKLGRQHSLRFPRKEPKQKFLFSCTVLNSVSSSKV